ncbi:tubulin-like doman-containing protein [Akkermansia sp. N21116]|uniref:tubulin-like doman-containing protein n=1 Tax=Akkermansia sp. N21116 TaxID=3040764 RepID=UPI00244E8032|nr:tubulin-like doman-containing protein [Akkermansia sp. N21116]WPX40597.1 tubulin-like doman-containing protein [Akkermansia sp. N21116]
MSNNLFIGLGGQGVKSIAALRRLSVTRAPQYKELTNPDDGNPKSKFDYLIIDSNIPNEVGMWRSMGKEVGLMPNQIVNISSSNLPPLSTLAASTHVQPWLDGIGFVKEALAGNTAIDGAGQMRRFGRLLGAANGSHIVQAIDGAVARFGDGAGAVQASCTFHIFATLGGGTGSGTIVDVVSYIRNRFSNKQNYPIYLYLYIAGEHAKNPRKTEFFYPNQYAALRDLNAINVGKYEPDLALLTEQKKTLSKADGVNGINQVVISCDVAGSNVNVELDAQIRHMAEICFNRVYAMDSGELNIQMKDSISGEDVVVNSPWEPSFICPERSYRFSVSCVKRWKVPVEECKENLYYFTYSQLLNRWLYQHWVTGCGYCKRSDITRKQADTLYKIITDGTSVDATASDKGKYEKDVEIAFKKIIDKYKSKGWKDSSLDELVREFDSILDNGVIPQIDGQPPLSSLNDFLKVQEQQVAILCDNIKDSLLALSGEAISQNGLVDMVNSLALAKKDFNNKVEEEKNRLDCALDRQKKLKKSLENRNSEQWVKITILSSVLGKAGSLLSAHGEDCLALFKSKLESGMRGVSFKLYEAVNQMLDKLVKYAEQTVDEFVTWEEKISARLKDSNSTLQNLKDDIFVKYEFNYQDLTNIHKEILNFRGELDSEMAFFDAMWKNSAKNMYEAVSNVNALNNLRNALEDAEIDGKSIWDAAVRLHDLAIENNIKLKKHPVLYGSLVDRLEARHIANPQMLQSDIKVFMDAMVSSSAITSSPGIQTQIPTPPPLGCMSLGIPDDGNFRTTLESLFSAARPNDLNIQNNYATYRSCYQYEICLMYMQYWMPARFVNAVKYLAKTYDYQDAVKNAKAKYFVNIDPSGERDMRPQLIYDPGEEQKGFALDAYWQAHLLTCGDPDNTCIITHKQNQLGQHIIVRNVYIEGHMGTETKILNQLPNGLYRTEEEYLNNVSMEDTIEIKTLVQDALKKIVALDETKRFVQARKLLDKARQLVESASDEPSKLQAQKGYNNFLDSLKKLNLVS